MKERDVNRNITSNEKPLFEIRESAFTTALRESSSAQSVYSLLIALHVIYAAYVLVLWIHCPQVYDADVSFILRVASAMPVCLLMEILLVSSVTVCTIATFRWKCYPALLPLLLVIVCLPLAVVRLAGIPELVSGFVMMEQIRFVFKTVSLVVELRRSGEVPTMKTIIYFLFAPTLVYQSEYPKSQSRDWTKILLWSAETAAMALTFILLISQLLVPAFRDVGKSDMTGGQLLEQIRASFVVGVYQMLIAGYVMLHVQQNWFAEVLLFGDRAFYRDWMSSLHPIDFARRWNRIVYIWIVRYVYRPILQKTGSKIFALLSVFVISFMSHDYVLNVAGNIFLPFFTMSVVQVMIATPVVLLMKKMVDQHPEVLPLLTWSNFPFLAMQMTASAVAVYSYTSHYYQTMNVP